MPLLSLFNKLAFPAGRAPKFDGNHIASRNISPGRGLVLVPTPTSHWVNLVDGTHSARNFTGVGPSVTTISDFGPRVVCPFLIDGELLSGQTTAANQFQTFAAIFSFTSAALSAGAGMPLIKNGGGGESITINGSTFIFGTSASPVSSGFTLTADHVYFGAISVNMTAFFGTSTVCFVLKDLTNGSLRVAIAQGGAGPNVGPATLDGTAQIYSTNPALEGGSLYAGMWSPWMMTRDELVQWSEDPWSFWYPDHGPTAGELDVFWPVISGHVTYNLAPDTGFYTLTGKIVGEKAARQLTQQTGFYAYTGEVVGEKAARKIALNAAFYNLTGEAAVETASRKLTSVTGFYSLTGEQVTEQLIRKLAAGTGFYALTGEAVSEVHQRNLATATGFYTLTGKNVTQIRALKEAPATGFYNFVGEVVTLSASGTFNLVLSTGFYALNGQTIVEAAARKEVPQSGFYTYTGEVVTPLRTRKLAPLTGFYAMTGEPVTYRWIHAMAPAPGKYTLNGLAVTLNKGSAVTIIAQPGLMGFDDSVVLIGLDDSTNLTGGI